MEKKHQVHNLIILDESGSMGSVKDITIQGFNEIVQTAKGAEQQFTDQEHFVSLITFNGLGQKLVHFLDPVSKLQEIDSRSYKPDASTPLYDALGSGILKLKQVVQDKTDYNVLVTVFTDGEENASREFSGSDIKNMIEELKNQRWTFTYIGTDHDVEKFAMSISIQNHMHFSKDSKGMRDMFDKEKSSRMSYYRKIQQMEDTKGDYYKDEEEENGNDKK